MTRNSDLTGRIIYYNRSEKLASSTSMTKEEREYGCDESCISGIIVSDLLMEILFMIIIYIMQSNDLHLIQMFKYEYLTEDRPITNEELLCGIISTFKLRKIKVSITTSL